MNLNKLQIKALAGKIAKEINEEVNKDFVDIYTTKEYINFKHWNIKWLYLGIC